MTARCICLTVLVIALLTGARADASSAVPCDTQALINAVAAADITPGPETLDLATGCIYVFTDSASASALTISDALTIYGNGATIMRNSSVQFRLFEVGAATTVSLSRLTISGGHAPSGVDGAGPTAGSPGGGISNGGTLTLSHVAILGNLAGNGGNNPSGSGANGGDGGGIYNSGVLKVIGSKISGNQAGVGGSATGSGATTVTGGTGGSGGGIYSTGTLTLARSVVSSNEAGHGGPASGGVNIGGTGGSGGGVYNDGTSSVSATKIVENDAGWGGGGSLSRGGDGGGLANAATRTTAIKTSTIERNEAGTGFGPGMSGTGGGIRNDGEHISPKKTVIKSNTGGSGSPDNCAPTGSVAHCRG